MRSSIHGKSISREEAMKGLGDPLTWKQESDDLYKEFSAKPKTLVVNLFAGPGSGKSTLATGIFSDLKFMGIECEYVNEYAKMLVWEKRNYTLDNQIYIFGKQHHRIFRLLGQVNVIITDSPILLSPIYDKEKRLTLEQLVVEEHNKMWNYNVFLKRKKLYISRGRLQNEEEAQEIDRDVLNVLDINNQPYDVFEASPDGKASIVKNILLLLENGSSTQKGNNS